MKNPNHSVPTPEQREEAIFNAALERSPAERVAFLDGACHGDPKLRQRLEALLSAHDSQQALPEPGEPQRPGQPVRTLKLNLEDVPDENVGQKIGRYKILEKIGEGGCGVVYVAEQIEPVRRRVALKVIKLGMDTKAVVARFEAERQALAMMDHPNIARVLDAGTTDVGRPYFVMELVRGIRLTDYCDQNKLSTAKRIDLFILVCHAIQHAHQKGIIHRDIKPSNILVTLHDGVPVPKVIDFGIAKAIEGKLTEATVYTQLHQFIGTPAYMSPEQAEMSGLDVDTRSDIYSLGVLLYELLTGRTPFDAKELMASGIDAMRKTIREIDPVRPSTRLATLQGDELTTTATRRSVETTKLARLLRGDLDWIVMKCLEKDRTRRYETANGLAADLKRHLGNEPVIARPPGSAYRFQKLVRRNKLAFAAAGAVTAALVFGLGTSTVLYFKESQAYQRAVAARLEADAARQDESRQRQQAEELVNFMMKDLQPTLTRYGRLPLLRQVVEKAVRYYDGLPPESRDLKTELARADSEEALGEILRDSGDVQGAEAAFTNALTSYELIAKRNPDIPEAPAGALMTLGYLASMKTTFTSSVPSDQLDADQQQRIREWRELYRRFPTSRLVKKGLIGTLLARAEIASYLFNKPQDAIAAGLEAESMLQVLVTSEPDNKDLSLGLAQSKVALSAAYEAIGQRDKSVELNEAAAAYFDEALKEDPGNLALLARAADAEKFLSYRVSPVSQKRARDAELIARERYHTLAELDPANAGWRYNFAMTHMMECYYLESKGQIEAARQALKKFDALLQPVSFSTIDREKLVANSIELARLAARVGDIADARAQLAVGESRFQTQYDKLPAGSFDRVQARVRWLFAQSRAFLGMHDWAELERTSREILATVESGLVQRAGDTELLLYRAVAQGFLGTALFHHGDASAALPFLRQAITGYRETPVVAAFKEDRDVFVADATQSLAGALAATGDVQQARNLLESTLAAEESRLATQPDSWELKDMLADAAIQLASVLDPQNSEQAVRRQSLLERAEKILDDPEAQGRLTVDDQEAKSKIKTLRAAKL
jgi:serine/threonine protein kinase